MKKSFLNKCVKKYGSPLYFYDLSEIDISYKNLKNSIPKNSKILYSIKANPNKEIIKKFKKLSCGFEVSSIGEAKKVLKCGVKSKNIFLTGPAKSYTDLKFAVENNLGTLSIESFNEIYILKKILAKKKTKINFVLRVNLEKQNFHSSIQMMSIPSQFGIDEIQILRKKKFLKNIKNINFVGFHFYSASNITDQNKIIKLFKDCIYSAKKLSDILNIKIKILNLGGGFACNHGKIRNNLKYNKVKKVVESEMKKHFSFSEQQDIDLYFESGRFLIGTCGGLITRVIDKKISKGEIFIILNSGINHLSGMTGIGRLQRLKPDYQILNQRNNKQKERVNIVGPLCTPLDFWNRSIYCRKFSIGDNVFVPNVSSYGLSASLVMFLGHELPKELIVDKNKVVSITQTKLID